MDNASSVKATCESPVDIYIYIYNVSYSPSDTEVNNPLRSTISSKSPKHWPTKSGSSSSAGPTPEKQEMDFVLLILLLSSRTTVLLVILRKKGAHQEVGRRRGRKD
ncbi:hypothetical protein KY284_021023 [Solanum tuberosum]|nr:hypothetical protein KY284_021023 [Solanum tuberosum]